LRPASSVGQPEGLGSVPRPLARVLSRRGEGYRLLVFARFPAAPHRHIRSMPAPQPLPGLPPGAAVWRMHPFPCRQIVPAGRASRSCRQPVRTSRRTTSARAAAYGEDLASTPVETDPYRNRTAQKPNPTETKPGKRARRGRCSTPDGEYDFPVEMRDPGTHSRTYHTPTSCSRCLYCNRARCHAQNEIPQWCPEAV
jgi:hypothetical protein